MTNRDMDTRKMLAAQLTAATGAINDRRAGTVQRALAPHKSTLSRLTRRYLVQGIIGVTGPVWIVLLASMMPVSGLMFWCYIAYTITFGIINLLMYGRLCAVPALMSLPVVDAQRAMIRLDNSRRLIKYAGMALGIPLVTLIFVEIAHFDDAGILWGGVAGGIIGGAIGLTWAIKNRRQMRRLVKAFDEPGDPCGINR